MDRLQSWASDLALIDLIALALLVLGVVVGLLRGLGPVFGMLLWLVASLWLAKVLTPVILGWMPNTPDASEQAGRFATYGALACLILVLPVLARLLGGTAGKKKKAPPVRDKPFGILVGLLCAVLLFTLVAPYARRLGIVSAGFDEARSPAFAIRVARFVTWLYPEAHVQALEPSQQPATSEAPAAAPR